MKPLSTRLIVLLVAVFLVLGGGLGAALDRAIPIWVRESSTSAPAAAANTAMQAPKAVPKVVAVPAAKAPAKTAPAPSVKAPVKAAPPAVQTPAPAASVAPKPVYSGPMAYPHSAAPGTGKTVALTFDDGPDPSTAQILGILNHYKVPATFFNIGQQEAKYASLVKAEAQQSYALGNHTWDHADLTKLDLSGQQREFALAEQETLQLTGVTSTLIRPPFGSYNAITEQVAGQAGMKMWTWSVDTLDWTHAGVLSQKDTDAIVNLAETEEIKLNHPVILTHNPLKGTPSTVAALPTIIEFFKAHGYTFVAL